MHEAELNTHTELSQGSCSHEAQELVNKAPGVCGLGVKKKQVKKPFRTKLRATGDDSCCVLAYFGAWRCSAELPERQKALSTCMVCNMQENVMLAGGMDCGQLKERHCEQC